MSSEAATPKTPVRVAPGELVREVDDFCAAKTLRRRTASLVGLVVWMRKSGASAAHMSGLGGFVEYLESDSQVRSRFQNAFAELLSEMDCVPLFSEAGIPSDHSFASEIGHRISARVLPSAREESDAAKLLVILYPTRKTVQHFLESSPELFQRLLLAVAPPDGNQSAPREYSDLQEALRLLASRVSALGLNPEVRARSSAAAVSESPFYQILAATEGVIHASSDEATGATPATWQGMVHRCRTEIVQVHEHMENAGVSVELIFDLRKITACLVRMEAIVDVLTSQSREGTLRAVHGLLGQLMEGRLADLSLRSLLRENLNLIARKMVERTGHSGEHYIAHNRAEYWRMWAAALGGGLLTVITAAVKLRIYDAHVPPFVEAFASGTNYAVSFIFLQILGLVLATKQPAATAATFAGIIRESRGIERENRLSDFVSRITSTQLAAALGNGFAVSIGAVFFERLWLLVFSQSYLAQGRMKKFSRTLQRNLGGWSTSIVLGYLLGFTPVLGKFFGLPLDVRHVTLSTGTLALAVAHFGARSMGRNWFCSAVAGIAVIFVLNLFVSFSIAAYVGLRAYEVSGREQWHILRFLVVDGLKSPLRFLWPSYMRRRAASVTEQATPEPEQ